MGSNASNKATTAKRGKVQFLGDIALTAAVSINHYYSLNYTAGGGGSGGGGGGGGGSGGSGGGGTVFGWYRVGRGREAEQEVAC